MPGCPPIAHRFTRENARVFAIRGNKARLAKRLAAKAAANPPAIASLDPASHDLYVARVLARVRFQLDMIDERITILASKQQPDALELERLSRAATHLSERERSLSMRPTPGQLRPVAPRLPSRSTLVAPSLPAPSLSPSLLNSVEQPASPSSAASSNSTPPLPPTPEHP